MRGLLLLAALLVAGCSTGTPPVSDGKSDDKRPTPIRPGGGPKWDAGTKDAKG